MFPVILWHSFTKEKTSTVAPRTLDRQRLGCLQRDIKNAQAWGTEMAEEVTGMAETEARIFSVQSISRHDQFAARMV